MAGGRKTGVKPVCHYDVLMVSPQDSDETIRLAYRRLALKFHPDHHPSSRPLSEHRFRLITEAYEALKTAADRQRYNQWLHKRENPHKPTGQADNDNVHLWPDILGRLFRPRLNKTEQ